MAEEAVTQQPKSKRAQIIKLVSDMDPSLVLDWNEEQVVEQFLKPCQMEHLAKAFIDSHITGNVLIALEEVHQKELGCDKVGDRIMLLDYLKVLKKHKKDLDRSQALWSQTTPVASCAYHESCGDYIKYICCHCCVTTKDWRVTGQGIRWRKNRARVNCCGENETQFIDYRFLKDIELREIPRCLCCCVGKELLIYADDKDSVTVHQTQRASGAHQPLLTQEPVVIRHPQARQAEAIIRNAWAESQLVAD